MLKKKCLYPVAVPIGNFDDFTLRAIQTLKDADLIIGEERATTERILKRLQIQNKEIIILNEHNEKTEAKNILNYIVKQNYSAAMISEAGTPSVADPGAILINMFHQNNLSVIPIPGVSSIMTALMVAGNENYNASYKYVGFLSQKKEIRQKELKELNLEKIPIIILDTPYRMKPLLKDIKAICGNQKKIVFTYKLTQPEEFIIKSNITDVIAKTENLKKGEFVVIMLP